MPLETSHVLNTLRSRRLPILIEAIRYVLKVILQNSTIRGFSYTIITKEVRKYRYKVAPRTI